MVVELFRYLPREENSGLGIPYIPKKGSRGMMEYFDLKKNPELIPKIRELKNRPELKNFVAELNKLTSIFRTLRCESRCSCSPGESSRWQTHWHFTFAFEMVQQNQPENFEALNDLLEKAVRSGQRRHEMAFDIRPVHTSYRDNGVTLWSQDLEIYGIGDTEETSEKEFIYALRLVRNFFYSESKKWFGNLGAGARIS